MNVYRPEYKMACKAMLEYYYVTPIRFVWFPMATTERFEEKETFDFGGNIS